MNDLEKFMTDNNGNEVLIFKFSPICGISSSVERELDKFLSKNPSIPILKIDVIFKRDISNKIADLFGIRHESPQLIQLNNKHEVEKYASHYEILDLLK